MTKINNKIVGKWGEDLACKYLEMQGYKILARNFACKLGEIDIIAKFDDCIVFIEVKTRSSDYFGRPSEAVNLRKQQKIRSSAQVFIKLKSLYDYSCRFDVMEILAGDINHIENCF